MVSKKKPDDFPWYQHQADFSPSAATSSQEIFRSEGDSGTSTYPHPAVQSRCLHIEIIEDTGGLDLLKQGIIKAFGKIDLQSARDRKSGSVWFQSVRQAEKALACHLGISTTPPSFLLLPISKAPILNPHPQPPVLILQGLPDYLDILSVYDLVRPWGCLFKLARGDKCSGQQDWLVNFVKEDNSKCWEGEWNATSFEGNKLTITALETLSMKSPIESKIRHGPALPLTPPHTIRRRRASADTEVDDIKSPAGGFTNSHGKEARARQPGWIAEYHGSGSRNRSSLLFTPAKKGSVGQELYLRELGGVDWVTLNCTNLHPDVSSTTLDQFFRKTSYPPLSVRLLRDRHRHSRGQAVLTFETFEAATRALRKCQGAFLRGRALNVTFERTHTGSRSFPVHQSSGTEMKVERIDPSSNPSISGRHDASHLIKDGGPADRRGIETTPVHRSMQTSAIPITIDAGSQTGPTPQDISVGCQAPQVGSTRSTSCQTRIVSDCRSVASQWDQQPSNHKSTELFRSTRACTELEQGWSTLPLIEPSTLRELVLYPAQSVWVFLFRSSEAIRTAFKCRHPDEEMQALTLDWLAIRNIEMVRENLTIHLGRLLRAWGFRKQSTTIASRFIRAEDSASVLMLMNVYPTILKEMITSRRRPTNLA